MKKILFALCIMLCMTALSCENATSPSEVTLNGPIAIEKETFDAPDKVTAIPQPDTYNISWGKVTDALYYRVFIRRMSDKQLFEYTPIRSSDYTILGITKIALGNILGSGTVGGQAQFGVCAVSYDGLMSTITWSEIINL